MFIQVNGRPLNVYSVLYYYTREIVKDDITSYGLYYRLTDGRVLEEIFESEEARDLKVEELGTATLGGLVQENTYDDFPDRGSKEIIYLAKDTGQMWVWDEALGQYEKVGVSRKGGVYQYSQDLPSTIGSTVEIAKTDLAVIIEPSVPFMDGSEITAHNAIRGIITKSTDTTVTVRTIADMVIDSFVQVENEESLPAKGELNVLYYLKDKKQVRIWNGTSYNVQNGSSVNNHRIITIADDQCTNDGIFNSIKELIGDTITTQEEWKQLIFLIDTFYGPVIVTFGGTAVEYSDSYRYDYSSFTVTSKGKQNSSTSGSRNNLGITKVRFSLWINNETAKINKVNDYIEESLDARYLDTDTPGDTPFIPTHPNHPVNKKYVDDRHMDSDVHILLCSTLSTDVIKEFANTQLLPAINKFGPDRVIVDFQWVLNQGQGMGIGGLFEIYSLEDDLITLRQAESSFSMPTLRSSIELLDVKRDCILTLSDGVCTSVSINDRSARYKVLPIAGNLPEIFLPENANDPTNKNYVDTNDNLIKEDIQEFKDEVHTTYSIFNGDEDEYEALTQEQKDAYFLAIVNPLITPENINLNTVEQIILDETPTETVIDMTDEEVDESLNTIINGGANNA